jgi:hypothetical protein
MRQSRRWPILGTLTAFLILSAGAAVAQDVLPFPDPSDGRQGRAESQAPNVRNGNLRAEISAEVPDKVNGVIFARGGYAGGVSLYARDGELFYEYSALLLKRDRIEVGRLPAGDVTIALEMKTSLERAAPAHLRFWINGEETATGTVRRTVPATFTASETFDVGMDTSSPVANDYFDMAPFESEGTLRRLHFRNLWVGAPGSMPWVMTEGRDGVSGHLLTSRSVCCKGGKNHEAKSVSNLDHRGPGSRLGVGSARFRRQDRDLRQRPGGLVRGPGLPDDLP